MPPAQAPLANRNNNPGDLRFVGQQNATQGQGGFASFPTAADGFAGLLNDVQSKINKNPNENLAEFASTYAPESDGNNSAKYAADLANQLGVAPDATIGSLEPNIGKFAEAVAKNEGYQPAQGNTGQGLEQTAGQAVKAVGGPAAATGLGVGAAALGGVGALLAGPEAIGEEALSGIGDALGSVGKIFTGGFGNSSPLGDSSSPASATASGTGWTTGNDPLASAPQAQTPAQAKPSAMYNTLQDMAGSTVGGQSVLQEGQNRGIDPIQVLEQSGAGSLLQPDENGILDKSSPTNFLNEKIGVDKGVQTQMVQSMHTPVNLDEMQAKAESEINSAMADTGEKQKALKEVGRIFDDYRSEQPVSKDERGNPRVDEQGTPVKSSYILPSRLQKKKELLSVSEKDFAKPAHERATATHVKEAMRKRLSEIAKHEGIKGWDETNRRMEAMVLAKKLINKLPKKAVRHKDKEFVKDLAASIAGGAVGELLGHGLAGGIAGHFIERQLGKKEYKKIGSKKERKESEEKGKKMPSESLAGINQRKER